MIAVRKTAPHVVKTWWDDRRNRKKAALAAKPTQTLLIAENVTMVRPCSWQIAQYDLNGAATGFRALIFLTRIVPQDVVITSTGAILPWRFRRKHHVVGAHYQAFRGSRGLREVVNEATQEGAINFYIQPPIRRSKPLRVTIRLRDQFLNWHERPLSFLPEPEPPGPSRTPASPPARVTT